MQDTRGITGLAPFLAYPMTGAGEQRERVAHTLSSLAAEVAACHEEATRRLVVPDVASLRIYLATHSEERAFVRELLAAGRLQVVVQEMLSDGDPVMDEIQRRNLLYGTGYCEGVLGGLPVLTPSPEAGPPARAAEAVAGARLAAAAVLRAEKAATFAGLLGARYPDQALDRAWRLVLSALFTPAGGKEVVLLDARAACQEASAIASEVTSRAAAHVAGQVDTRAAKGAGGGFGALVVLNLEGRPLTGACRARVKVPSLPSGGLQVLDPSGRPTPYQVLARTETAVTLSFPVSELPPIGYRTYVLRAASGALPSPTTEPQESVLTAAQAPVQAGALPPEFALVTMEGAEVAVVVMKPLGNPLADLRTSDFSEAGHGVLLRLHAPAETRQEVQLGFGFELRQAWTVGMEERKRANVAPARGGWRRAPHLSVYVPGGETAGMAVVLQPPPSTAVSVEIAPDLGERPPAHGRYWQHNAGAAPFGNLALGLWSDGTFPRGGNTRFPMSLSNDATDRERSGTVTATGPDGWTLLPRQIPYRVPAASQALYEIMVIVPEKAPSCFLRLSTEGEGGTIQEVLPVGEILPLEASLVRDGEGWWVTLLNPNPDYVEGDVTLIAAGGAEAGVSPWYLPFRLEAKTRSDFRVEAEGSASTGLVAKVAWYGHVQYVRETAEAPKTP
jgi:hypothetical protein